VYIFLTGDNAIILTSSVYRTQSTRVWRFFTSNLS